MCGHLRGLQIGQHIGFVGATGVLDDTHAGLVQRISGGELGFVCRAHQRHFAKRCVARQHVHQSDAVHVAGDATHGHVELVGLQVFHQVGPRGLHIFHLHTQLFGHGFDQVDVMARKPGVGLDGKRAVVAGCADTDHLGLHDLVEARAGLCGLGESQADCHGGNSKGECFFHGHMWKLQRGKRD